MYLSTDIPEWEECGTESIATWWRAMVAATNTVFHPDDAPESVVDPEGRPCFSDEASEKLSEIMDRMLESYGDLAYEQCQVVFMGLLGWQWCRTDEKWVKTNGFRRLK